MDAKDFDEMTAEEKARHFYALRATTKRDWIGKANELEAAAQSLRPDVERWWDWIRDRGRREPPKHARPEHGFHDLYLMLMGLCIENLCKAELLQKGEAVRVLEERGELPSHVMTHNLQRLVERVGLKTSNEERGLLARMREAVMWSGRYPLDLKPKVRIRAGQDLRTLDGFLERLRDRLGAPRSYLPQDVEGASD